MRQRQVVYLFVLRVETPLSAVFFMQTIIGSVLIVSVYCILTRLNFAGASG